MLRKSNLEESIAYRLVWEFVTDTLIFLTIFGFYIYIKRYIIQDISSDLLLPGFILLGLIKFLISSLIRNNNIKAASSLILFIIFSGILISPGQEDIANKSLHEFIILLFFYIFINSLIIYAHGTNIPLAKGILTFLTFFIKLGFPIILTYILFRDFKTSYEIDFRIFRFDGEPYISYAIINSLIFILSTTLTLALLSYRSSRLENLSKKLKTISSWSLDDKVIEKNLLNNKMKIQHKNRTIVFGDIRGFTAFSEHNDIGHVMSILEYLYTIVEKTVDKYGGFKPEFIADAFLTFFDDSKKAISFSFEIRDKVNDFLGKYNLGMGQGLDKGQVLEGIVGGTGSKKYTILGSAVNAAARLQAKAETRQILISRNVLNAVPNLIYEKIDGIELKGVSKEFEVFNIKSFSKVNAQTTGVVDKIKGIITKNVKRRPKN